MARINNEEAQWIILMGLIISISIFILAIIVNQSMIVGQTTAESVLDFPKSDIQDLRSEIFRMRMAEVDQNPVIEDIQIISLIRKSAIVYIDNTSEILIIHYNNGVTSYNETIRF